MIDQKKQKRWTGSNSFSSLCAPGYSRVLPDTIKSIQQNQFNCCDLALASTYYFFFLSNKIVKKKSIFPPSILMSVIRRVFLLFLSVVKALLVVFGSVCCTVAQKGSRRLVKECQTLKDRWIKSKGTVRSALWR